MCSGKNDVKDGCKCLDEKVSRNLMGESHFCARWDNEDDPWCYTKDSCGEQGNNSTWQWCNKPISCETHNDCGGGNLLDVKMENVFQEKNDVKDGCKCLDEKVSRNLMAESHFCARWDNEDNPWCYTKDSCGEQRNNSSWQWCNKPINCKTNNDCGGGEFARCENEECVPGKNDVQGGCKCFRRKCI